MKSTDRFEVITESSGLISEMQIIIDRQTGVNYLWVHDGYAGGLTPLLDENGDPIISE